MIAASGNTGTITPAPLTIVVNPQLEKTVAYGVDLLTQYVTSYDIATKQTVTQHVYTFNGLVPGETLAVHITTTATIKSS